MDFKAKPTRSLGIKIVGHVIMTHYERWTNRRKLGSNGSEESLENKGRDGGSRFGVHEKDDDIDRDMWHAPATAKVQTPSLSASQRRNIVPLHQRRIMLSESLLFTHLCRARAQDVGVTSVENGHGGASEEFTACSAEFDL